MSVKRILLWSAALFLLTSLSLQASAPANKGNYSIRYTSRADSGASILGIVYDWISGDVLGAASIQSDRHIIGTITDKLGKFEIMDVPTGKIGLWISIVGYETLLIPNIQILPDRTAILSISLTPIAVPLGKEVVVKGVRKKIEFLQSSRMRIRARPYPLYLLQKSPMITVDYESGIPLFNVIPVSEVAAIMEDNTPSEWPPVSHLIPWPDQATACYPSMQSVSFVNVCLWWKNRRAQAADASLPIVDEIDKRRIMVEINKIEDGKENQILKK